MIAPGTSPDFFQLRSAPMRGAKQRAIVAYEVYAYLPLALATMQISGDFGCGETDGPLVNSVLI